MSLFSWQCQNLCLLSLAFIIDWRVVSEVLFGLVMPEVIVTRPGLVQRTNWTAFVSWWTKTPPQTTTCADIRPPRPLKRYYLHWKITPRSAPQLLVVIWPMGAATPVAEKPASLKGNLLSICRTYHFVAIRPTYSMPQEYFEFIMSYSNISLLVSH